MAIVILVCILFIRKKKICTVERKKMSRKNKQLIIIVIALIIIIISMRVYSADNIIDFTFKNFTISTLGAFEAFSQVYERIQNDGPVVNCAVLRMFFTGITSIFDALFVNVLHLNILFIQKEINSYISDVIFIGPNMTFNAFYTAFYPFLATGGVVGSLFASILMATSCAVSYNYFRRKPSVPSCMLYILWLYIIMFGVIEWVGGLTEWACIVLIILSVSVRLKIRRVQFIEQGI